MNTIENLFSGGTSYAFAWTMIHSLWQFALVAVALAVSLRLTPRHNAGLRYLQGIFALGVCVALSGMTFFHYYDSALAAGRALQGAGPDAVIYSGGLWEVFYTTLNDSVHYIMLVWVLGFAVQFSRYVFSFVQAALLKNRGCEPVSAEWQHRFTRLVRSLRITRPVSFRNSMRVTSCCIIGHFKPVVLLPVGLLTQLSVEQVEAVVLHELAHIKRNDYLVNAIQYLVRVIYFFNPAILWISSRIDLERESACDDVAVRECGDSRIYANSLARTSELDLRLATVLAANSNRYQTLSRIKRLFSDTAGVSKSVERLASAVCAGLLVLTMNVSADQLSTLKAERPWAAEEAAEAADDAAVETEPQVRPAPAPQPVEERRPVEASQLAREAREEVQTPAQTPRQLALEATPAIDYTARAAKRARAETAVKKEPEPLQLASAADERRALAANGGSAEGEDGLEAIKVAEFDQFYLASDFSIPASRKVYIDKVQAEFANVWTERFRALTSEDYRSRLLKQYGEALVAELTDSLQASGWQVVESPESDAVRLQPKLFDIYIVAPDVKGRKETLVGQSGQGGVELLFETPDGKAFMKIVDYRNTAPVTGNALANRATNYRYFRMLMSDWADDALKYLDNVMSIVENQNQA